MPGPPKLPREVKRLRGTLQPSRDPQRGELVVLEPTESAGEVPEFADGRAMLQAMLDAGAAHWVGPTDRATAELARQLWDDRDIARDRWTKRGGVRNFQAYLELTKRLQACLSQLGLDPAGRSRLGVAEVKARSTLERLQAAKVERAERRAGRRAT
jgi:hypothetical protein